MDPSIVKLLEVDVDESMNSGADVDAFTAAINRDIGGDMDSISGPSDSATGGTSQEGAPRPNEGVEMGQTSGQTLENQQIEQGTVISDQSNNVARKPDVNTRLPIGQTQAQTRPRVQLPTNQQGQGVPATATKKTANGAPTIPFQMLMPILQQHLDKDSEMQLQQVLTKLRRNEISKEDFMRGIRNIVGDKMLRQAAHTVHLQMQAQEVKAAQTTPTTNSSASMSTSASTLSPKS